MNHERINITLRVELTGDVNGAWVSYLKCDLVSQGHSYGHVIETSIEVIKEAMIVHASLLR